jgi:hypothetical protein
MDSLFRALIELWPHRREFAHEDKCKIPELTEKIFDDLKRLKDMLEGDRDAMESSFIIQFLPIKHELCKFADSHPTAIVRLRGEI